MDVVTIELLSLGSGALIVTMALSLVLTYRSTNVINFGAGSTAGYVAYVYWDLTANGHLFVGVANIPLGGTLSPLLAFIIAALEGAGIGYLQYFFVYRPLREASPLAKIVASTGVLLVLEALPILWFGANTVSVMPLISARSITAGSLSIPMDRLIVCAIVLAGAAGLSVLFRFSPFGIRTRAVADSRKGAMLLGINPGRVESLNWVLASGMTGIIGILVTPLTGLGPDTMTVFMVSALGALLLANLRSFWIATAAGFAIGAVQGLVVLFQGYAWFPQAGGAPIPGVSQTIPFVVIAVVLFVRGRKLPDRLTVRTALPHAPRPNKLLIRFGSAIVLGMIMIVFAPPGWRQATITTMIAAVVCMSIVVIAGYLGQVTIAQTAIVGVAGFVCSKLATAFGIGFPLGPLLAIIVAGLVGLVLAIPALRMRGMQLAIITLAGAVAIDYIWFLNPAFGGGNTAATVPPASLFGLKLGSANSFWNFGNSSPSPGFAVFILLITCLVAWGVVMLRRSSLGARMLAIRSDEAAAAAVGVNIQRTKFIAYGIAGLIGGIGGVLYGYNYGSVEASQYDALTAVSFLAVAYLGGLTTVTGAVIGGMTATQGIMMYTITTLFHVPSQFQLLIGGVAVIATVTGNPDGMAGFFRVRFARLGVRLRAGRAPAVSASAGVALAGGAGGMPVPVSAGSAGAVSAASAVAGSDVLGASGSGVSGSGTSVPDAYGSGASAPDGSVSVSASNAEVQQHD